MTTSFSHLFTKKSCLFTNIKGKKGGTFAFYHLQGERKP